MKVCILGASGMLGHTLFYQLSQYRHLEVWGTVRNIEKIKKLIPIIYSERLVNNVNAYDFTSIEKVLNQLRPDVVVNCIGLIRQLPEGQKHLPCIEINARLPHLLLDLCSKISARLIHYSSDCVFDGQKAGAYTEEDPCTANDVYGLTKYLGEVTAKPALTIRTSLIGPELRNKLSLVEWFLAQEGEITGFTHAIYTGLTTVEHSRILADVILPRKDMFGIYQVAAHPVSKYELLKLISQEYGKEISIKPSDLIREDKRLSPQKFASLTGYIPPAWDELVAAMHQNHESYIKAIS